MDKFDRNYILLIQRRDGTTIKVTRPFTIEFDITRNSLSSANVSQIRIYNLSEDNRNELRKDQFDFARHRTVQFFAGYGKNLSLAFTGNITQAWSVREGNNMITQIECFDGGYAYTNAVTGSQFGAKTQNRTVIDALATSLKQFGVQKGAIGDYPGSIPRGNSYSGSTTELLGELSKNGFFIDNGKAHCLNDDECLEAEIPLINAQSGLLGTPVKEQTYINFEMLFEPGLKIGQLLRLETKTAERTSNFKGTHKLISLHHRGVISDAVCGEAVTSVGLLPGVFKPVMEGGL